MASLPTRSRMASWSSLFLLACSSGGGGGAPAIPPTPGELCVASASFDWTSSTGGSWSGCTPDAADDFHSGGFSVRITQDLEIHGRIVADAGGRIAVTSGVTLSAADALRAEDGGTLELSGREMLVERITGVTWSARSVRIELGRRVEGLIQPGDLVHVLDDYGDAVEPIAAPFQTRAGSPLLGMTRPSYARGWMFRITGASGNGFSASLDDWHGVGTPYVGRRGIGGQRLRLLEAGSLPTFHGLVSALRLDPASLQVVEGDLSDQYVEIVTGPCAGKLAKIVGTSDLGGTAGDLVYVAGPWQAEDGVTDCGAGDAWIDIHYGLRRGDPIAVYRVARVDGMGTGFVDIRDGHLEADRFDLQNLGFLEKSSVTPPLGRHANVAFRHGEQCGIPRSGFMRRGNIANFRTPSPESDVAAVYTVAHGETSSWNGCGTFDLSNLVTFDQLAIHDTWSSDPVGRGGTHGFYSDGAGVRATRLLVARVSDDGIGGGLSGFDSEPQPFVIEDARVFGVLPDVEKSAECFEPGGANAFDPRTGWSEQQRVRGLITARDLIAIGCSREAVNLPAYGATMDRVVISGGNYLEVANPGPLFSVAPSTNLIGASGIPLDDPQNQSLVRDALVFLIGRQHSSVPFIVAGRCEGCVVVGDVGRVAFTRLWNVTDYARSFLHFTTSGTILEEAWGAPSWYRTTLSLDHSVLLSEWATRLGTVHEHLAELHVTRSEVGLAGGPHRILEGVADTGARVEIDGVVGTTAGAAAATSLGVTPSVQLADPCLETTLDSDASAFDGVAAAGTVIRQPGPGPDAMEFAAISDHRATPSGLCSAAAPQSLGLGRWNVGRVHADLGDLFLDHLDRVSSAAPVP